jgi:hypothetical protein
MEAKPMDKEKNITESAVSPAWHLLLEVPGKMQFS